MAEGGGDVGTRVRVVLKVNGQERAYEGDPDKPLLWYLRDDLRLTGARYGCGAGLCGACTVHVGADAVRACTLPMGAMAGQAVTTIEGLGKGIRLHPVQQAWIEEDVAPCASCQTGQIMAVVALLEKKPHPTGQDIAALTTLCRCGTNPRARRAIAKAVRRMGRSS